MNHERSVLWGLKRSNLESTVAIILGLEQLFRVQLTTESLTLNILLLTFLRFLVFHPCTIFRRRRVRAWATKALRCGCIRKRPVTTNSWVPVLFLGSFLMYSQ